MRDFASERQTVHAGLNVLILAGRRGPHEPLAQAAGCSHKALIPIHGIPMLDRVVHTLRTVQGVQRVAISTDEPTCLERLDELRELAAAGLLHFHGVGDSPSASVLKYLSQLPAGELLLVITADHPLLTTEMLEYFCAAARQNDADLTVGVMAESLFRTYYPDSKRSFIPLRGERFCGTNLFALRGGPGAEAAATFWNHAGQFRKRPWRLLSTFGVWNLVLIALRRLDAEAARKSAEKVIGADIAVVQMPFVESAIDVDNAGDLVLVARILSERDASGAA